MKYLLDFGFTIDEIENLRSNIPPVLEEQLFNSYRLVSKNILFKPNNLSEGLPFSVIKLLMSRWFAFAFGSIVASASVLLSTNFARNVE